MLVPATVVSQTTNPYHVFWVGVQITTLVGIVPSTLKPLVRIRQGRIMVRATGEPLLEKGKAKVEDGKRDMFNMFGLSWFHYYKGGLKCVFV